MIGMDGVAKQTPSILGEGVIFLLIVDFCFLILTLFRMECWVARTYWETGQLLDDVRDYSRLSAEIMIGSASVAHLVQKLLRVSGGFFVFGQIVWIRSHVENLFDFPACIIVASHLLVRFSQV
jgi:hypothetical protein